jgi:hypothetical protein
VENYPRELCEVVKMENLSDNLFLNVNETGLFWKKMPSGTFIFR